MASGRVQLIMEFNEKMDNRVFDGQFNEKMDNSTRIMEFNEKIDD